MTDWGAIAEQGKEQDTLEKIRDDITGALVPLIESMLPTPTCKQFVLLRNEMLDIVNRLNYMIVRVGRDANAV